MLVTRWCLRLKVESCRCSCRLQEQLISDAVNRFMRLAISGTMDLLWRPRTARVCSHLRRHLIQFAQRFPQFSTRQSVSQPSRSSQAMNSYPSEGVSVGLILTKILLRGTLRELHCAVSDRSARGAASSMQLRAHCSIVHPQTPSQEKGPQARRLRCAGTGQVQKQIQRYRWTAAELWDSQAPDLMYIEADHRHLVCLQYKVRRLLATTSILPSQMLST